MLPHALGKTTLPQRKTYTTRTHRSSLSGKTDRPKSGSLLILFRFVVLRELAWRDAGAGEPFSASDRKQFEKSMCKGVYGQKTFDFLRSLANVLLGISKKVTKFVPCAILELMPKNSKRIWSQRRGQWLRVDITTHAWTLEIPVALLAAVTQNELYGLFLRIDKASTGWRGKH